MIDVFRPETLADALDVRAGRGAVPFAGGTDVMVRHRGYTGTPPKIIAPVLFLDRVAELRAIERVDGGADREAGGALRIGAAVTLAELLDREDLPILLRRAISLIAAPALRNRATLVGNVCNASPAGDSLPPLYVHKAMVEIAAADGTRTEPIESFVTGPGSTSLNATEIVTAITVPPLPVDGRTYYRKVGTRRANALSKLSVAGYALVGGATDGAGAPRIRDLRIAVGAVAPTVIRLTDVESAVRTRPVSELGDPAVRSALLRLAAPMIRPIDDQRSTAAYRTTVALNALEEFLISLTEDT